MVGRYKVRYRDPDGRAHSETKDRLVDAERRKAEIELALATDRWRDPRRGDVLLSAWAEQWLPTRHNLRATTFARLEITLNNQVLPRFGSIAPNTMGNSDIRAWVSTMLAEGLSAATTRKAVSALRQRLATAVEDERIPLNPALSVPLPCERQSRPATCPRPGSNASRLSCPGGW